MPPAHDASLPRRSPAASADHGRRRARRARCLLARAGCRTGRAGGPAPPPARAAAPRPRPRPARSAAPTPRPRAPRRARPVTRAPPALGRAPPLAAALDHQHRPLARLERRRLRRRRAAATRSPCAGCRTGSSARAAPASSRARRQRARAARAAGSAAPTRARPAPRRCVRATASAPRPPRGSSARSSHPRLRPPGALPAALTCASRCRAQPLEQDRARPGLAGVARRPPRARRSRRSAHAPPTPRPIWPRSSARSGCGIIASTLPARVAHRRRRPLGAVRVVGERHGRPPPPASA